jgi:hypothetical protein
MNDKLQTILSAPIVYNVTEEALRELEDTWKDVPDCNDKEGYRLATRGIGDLRTLRVNVEKRRKELKKDALEYGRNVDKTAKSITGRIVALEDPMKAAKQVVDDAKRLEKERKEREEQERIDKIRGMIAVIEDAPNLPWNATLEDARDKMSEVVDTEILEDVFQEYTEEATLIKARTSEKLFEIIKAKEEEARLAFEQRIEQERIAKEQEAERKRLQAEREAMAEQRRKEEEKAQQIRNEEIKKVQAQQEELRRKEAELAEQQRKIELKAEKERAELAEQQRKIDEANELKRIEEEKKAAEKEKRRIKRENEKIQKEQRQSMVNYINELGSTVEIVDAIIAGEVPHVKYTG